MIKRPKRRRREVLVDLDATEAAAPKAPPEVDSEWGGAADDDRPTKPLTSKSAEYQACRGTAIMAFAIVAGVTGKSVWELDAKEADAVAAGCSPAFVKYFSAEDGFFSAWAAELRALITLAPLLLTKYRAAKAGNAAAAPAADKHNGAAAHVAEDARVP